MDEMIVDDGETAPLFGKALYDHVPASGFEAALKACPARFILGLTATPRRKDGLQKLLHLQCGLVRRHLAYFPDTALARRLITRTCAPDLPPPDAPIHQLWSALVNCRARNEQIAADIVACLREGRAIAVLSDRREHLANLHSHTARLLAESLAPSRLADSSDTSHPSAPLHRIDGSTGRRERAVILADLATRADINRGFALFATASLLGEGFDLPRLDTLFLTTPISFSGRVVQYAGRLHHAHANKTDVRIYDYHEPAPPPLRPHAPQARRHPAQARLSPRSRRALAVQRQLSRNHAAESRSTSWQTKPKGGRRSPSAVGAVRLRNALGDRRPP